MADLLLTIHIFAIGLPEVHPEKAEYDRHQSCPCSLVTALKSLLSGEQTVRFWKISKFVTQLSGFLGVKNGCNQGTTI